MKPMRCFSVVRKWKTYSRCVINFLDSKTYCWSLMDLYTSHGLLRMHELFLMWATNQSFHLWQFSVLVEELWFWRSNVFELSKGFYMFLWGGNKVLCPSQTSCPKQPVITMATRWPHVVKPFLTGKRGWPWTFKIKLIGPLQTIISRK